MTKPTEISDNHGWPWLVYQGDPAYQYVQRLLKNHVLQVVLPRHTILTGELVSVKVPTIQPSDLTPETIPVILRLVRCNDCTQFLGA